MTKADAQAAISQMRKHRNETNCAVYLPDYARAKLGLLREQYPAANRPEEPTRATYIAALWLTNNTLQCLFETEEGVRFSETVTAETTFSLACRPDFPVIGWPAGLTLTYDPRPRDISRLWAPAEKEKNTADTKH